MKENTLPEEPTNLSKKRTVNAVERNITSLAQERAREAHDRKSQDKMADAITKFSGDMRFIYLHIIWFAVWILMNTKFFGFKFDPYPYQLLTMIVSLEAIILSTFVLISQNRLSAQTERRSELDMHIGLLTEHELTHALKMLDAIQDKLGIDNEADEELIALEADIEPKDVIEAIKRIESRFR